MVKSGGGEKPDGGRLSKLGLGCSCVGYGYPEWAWKTQEVSVIPKRAYDFFVVLVKSISLSCFTLFGFSCSEVVVSVRFLRI